jgi:hypothetical protein
MSQNQSPDAAAAVGTEPAATSGSRGTRALAGAVIAVVGVLAAVNPESVFFRRCIRRCRRLRMRSGADYGVWSDRGGVLPSHRGWGGGDHTAGSGPPKVRMARCHARLASEGLR